MEKNDDFEHHDHEHGHDHENEKDKDDSDSDEFPSARYDMRRHSMKKAKKRQLALENKHAAYVHDLQIPEESHSDSCCSYAIDFEIDIFQIEFAFN